MSKAVNVIKDGEVIKTCANINACSKEVGIPASSIAFSINNNSINRKTGLIFKYADKGVAGRYMLFKNGKFLGYFKQLELENGFGLTQNIIRRLLNSGEEINGYSIDVRI